MATIIIAAVSGTIGCAFGLFIASCCHAAGREDEAVERHLKERENVR